MDFKQIDMPDSGISADIFDRPFDVIGANVYSFRNADRLYSCVKIISSHKTLSAEGFRMTGRSSEIRRLLGFCLSQIPSSDIFDSGKYCIVSSMGADMLITLTKEGAMELARNGILKHMFQEMDNGTRLSLHGSDRGNVVFGPNVRVLNPLSSLERDERIWHLPKCETKGAAFFWETLKENGYVRLEMLNR